MEIHFKRASTPLSSGLGVSEIGKERLFQETLRDPSKNRGSALCESSMGIMVEGDLYTQWLKRKTRLELGVRKKKG